MAEIVRCENCNFVHTVKNAKWNTDIGDYEAEYYCHFNPPQVIRDGEVIKTVFPRVLEDSWCGRHRHKDKLLDAILSHKEE